MMGFTIARLFLVFFVAAAVKATGCNLEKVNILPSALITPLMPSSMIKNEDVAPMEVSTEKCSPPVLQVSLVGAEHSSFQILELPVLLGPCFTSGEE